MKYIKQILWKLLQAKPKSESILKKPRRKKSAIKRKLEKDLWRFAEDNKDADGNVDSPRWRESIIYHHKEEHVFIHEAKIRRELILRSIKDDEVYIHGSKHEKQYVFSSTLEEVLFEEKP